MARSAALLDYHAKRQKLDNRVIEIDSDRTSQNLLLLSNRIAVLKPCYSKLIRKG